MDNPEIKSDEEADVELDLAVEHVKIAHEKVFGLPPDKKPETVWDRFKRIQQSNPGSSNGSDKRP